jgi:thioredoxin 1
LPYVLLLLALPSAAVQFPQHRYAVAQVETMTETVSTIRYTPTFAIYRDGLKVDEVIGKEPQKLADHLWLHTD